ARRPSLMGRLAPEARDEGTAELDELGADAVAHANILPAMRHHSKALLGVDQQQAIGCMVRQRFAGCPMNEARGAHHAAARRRAGIDRRPAAMGTESAPEVPDMMAG